MKSRAALVKAGMSPGALSCHPWLPSDFPVPSWLSTPESSHPDGLSDGGRGGPGAEAQCHPGHHLCFGSVKGQKHAAGFSSPFKSRPPYSFVLLQLQLPWAYDPRESWMTPRASFSAVWMVWLNAQLEHLLLARKPPHSVCPSS